MSDNDEDFLKDLSNENFVNEEKVELTKEEKAQQKEHIRLQKALEKERIRNEKVLAKEQAKILKESQKKPSSSNSENPPDDDIFDEKGTVILGAEKRQLLAKISQYKSLFPIELKSFKVKRGASIKDLQEVLAEFDAIVNSSNMETFLLDGILSSIKVIEGVSSNTRNYDVTGLSDILKSNINFISLCKQMFLKYNIFSKAPIEFQLMMLVSTTAFVVRQKNIKKKEINSYLDQPYTSSLNHTGII